MNKQQKQQAEENRQKIWDQFLDMIFKSWTYNAMTEEEKGRLIQTYNSVQVKKAQKGTKAQQWAILQAIYRAFLDGLGYSGWTWRQPAENVPKF